MADAVVVLVVAEAVAVVADALDVVAVAAVVLDVAVDAADVAEADNQINALFEEISGGFAQVFEHQSSILLFLLAVGNTNVSP